MIHCCTVAVKKYYKCYIDDNEGTMTDEEIEEKTRKLLSVNPELNLIEDEDIDIEPCDILGVDYDYSFDGDCEDDEEQQ